MRRTIRKIAGVAVVAAVMAGCSGSDEPPQSVATLSAAQAAPEVNRDSGQIVLPADRFFLSPDEAATLASALALGMSKCATVQGVDTPYEPLTASTGSNRLYGVWSQAEAEQFGYGLPDEAEASAGSKDSEGTLTKEDLEVYIECNDSADLKPLRYDQIRPAFNYGKVFADTSEQAFESPEGVAAFRDWEACLDGQGVMRDSATSPFMIRGTTMDASESNIRIALIDVTCKADTQFVERLAAAEAAIQVPIIDQYLPELLQMRDDYDEALDFARTYLAENS
jgi:hypothetical protein